MMPLHATISREELETETERFDLFQYVLPCLARVDEVHPSEDNDGEYIFLVWLADVDREQQVVRLIEKAHAESEAGWGLKVFSHDCGFLTVHTWV